MENKIIELEKDELINKKEEDRIALIIEKENFKLKLKNEKMEQKIQELEERYVITNNVYYDELNKVEKLEKENKELIDKIKQLLIVIDNLTD